MVCLVVAFFAGLAARDSGMLAGVDSWRQSVTQEAATAIGDALNGSTGAQSGQSQSDQSQSDQSQSDQSQSGGDDQQGGQNWFGPQDQQQAPDQSGTQTTTAASAAQTAGVVIIRAELSDQQAVAEGTGMVLTADGTILTNNHVVEGASSIRVEVASTGTTYRAVVVGTDPTADVAVLKLVGASGLTTVKVNTSGDLAVGDDVTGIGNAGGGGVLVAASGSVTALNEQITTQADQSSASESLTGLIETDAPIEAGDSGGPLMDADGEVVGMDTAASTGGMVRGYAIPISTAIKVAKEIASAAGSNLALAA